LTSEKATASAAVHGRSSTDERTSEKAKVPIAGRNYRWRTGDCLETYGISAKLWNQHSSTDEFAAAFKTIIEDETLTNDSRSDRVEEFLLA
jgi:hypothetical protein